MDTLTDNRELLNEAFAKTHAFTNVSHQKFDLFLSKGTYKECENKKVLLEIGAKEKKLFFVLEGIIRMYVQDEEGKEHNKVLSTTPDLVRVQHLNLFDIPSKEGVQCITECKVIEFKYEDILSLIQSDTEIALFYYRLSLQKYIELEGRNIDLISKEAEERYNELRAKIKDIDNKISQYHIASFLGITPIQLSRIRKKLFSE